MTALYTRELFHYLTRMIAHRLLLLVCLVATAVSAQDAGPVPGGSERESDAVIQRPVWPSHAEHVGESAAPSESVAPDEAAPAEEVDLQTGFVLQLGAYSERRSAEQAAARAGLDNPRIMTTLRDGRVFYVLVLGPYAVRADAELASEAYLRARPDASVWVRAASDLKMFPAEP